MQYDAVMQGAVLLTNGGGVLPLDLGALGTIAVVGPNGGGCLPDPTSRCDVRYNMMGGYAPDYVSVPTVEDAVRSAFPSASVTFLAGAAINSTTPDWAALDAATAAAAASDAVLVVLGDSACEGTPFGVCTAGEGADRVGLDLPGTQQALLKVRRGEKRGRQGALERRARPPRLCSRSSMPRATLRG